VRGVVEAALGLAGEGLPVFPCTTNKVPTCPSGFKAATRESASVRELWRRYPGALVGVRTGAESGFDVLDLDVKHPEARAWWVEKRQRLPETRTHRTKSGGLHLILEHATDVRCSAGRIAPGVDTRGDGGYIVWWPAAGYPVLSDLPLAPWPMWLVAMLRPPTSCRSKMTMIVPDDHGVGGLVRAIVTAPVGSRNNVLFWASCRMAQRVRSKLLDPVTALVILIESARRAGISDTEARRTALSGLRGERC
jgi:hypothetical protein